jgi:hypothetical protein
MADFAREDFGFHPDMFEIQFASFNCFVAIPEAAIYAVVDTVVACKARK